MTMNVDLVDLRFGKLTCIARAGSNSTGTLWRLRCDCGGELTRATGDLRRKRRPARSCGCGAHDDRPLVTIHGHARNGRGKHPSRTYYSWQSMKNRCHNPTHKSYAGYGGRGIFVCARWLAGFESFLADMGEVPDGHSLERIDNSKGYEPSNCKWATAIEQNGNRRTVRYADGIPLKAYARREGVRYTSLLKWVDRGLTPAEAVAHVRKTATKQLPTPIP